mmetsp:Transcript_51471/g.122408  ORF Transcript_51471/g.122408 Transcript_51471/m.122408 type:complete len:431 (-) Transcript_51471:70-1362(-)
MQYLFAAGSGLEVRARQKLSKAGKYDPEALEALNAQLAQTLAQSRARGQHIMINDFDISQNHIPATDFEALLMTLIQASVKVQRFRLFGCPTIDDTAAIVLAEYLQKVLPEHAPYEVHLSDCALTTMGFDVIMDALDQNGAAFPHKNMAGKFVPLYMRLENNYIDPAAIQMRVDAGNIIPFDKKKAMSTAYDTDTGKIHLVVHQDRPRDYRQKAGDPPPPEKAPPPKQVWDKEAKEKQAAEDAMRAWQQQQQQRAQPQWPAQPAAHHQQGWQPATRSSFENVAPAQQQHWQAQQAAAAHAQAWQHQQAAAQAHAWQSHQAAAHAHNAWQSQQAAAAWQNQAAQQAWQSSQASSRQTGSQAHANGATQRSAAHAERSRSPAQREKPPAAKAMPGKKQLPPPWEEHHSDEYNIPYYWNADTGESSWTWPPKP